MRLKNVEIWGLGSSKIGMFERYKQGGSLIKGRSRIKKTIKGTL